jgi:membrane fusion protein
MSGLFRREVIEHRSGAWLGDIQVTRPLSLWMLCALALTAAAAIAAFLYVGEYTRKARVTGLLVPDRGVIRLVSPQPATVVESHVSEGRAVKAGDVLYVLSVEQFTTSGNAQSAVQDSLRARERSLQSTNSHQMALEKERLSALDRQIDAMRNERAQMDSEMQLQEQRLVLARQALARLESLRGENFVSAAQVQTKTEEILGLQAQMQSLLRQRAVHQREIDELSSRRREIPLQTQALQGVIERDMAELAQQSAENEARRRVVVRAPQDGVVSGVVAQPGQAVTPTTALATLLPADARLQAHLFAPSSAVGFLRNQQVVQLRYQAFPYQKFGVQSGQVVQVSRSPLQPSELGSVAQGTQQAGEPLYRITVALDQQSINAYGQAQSLVPGMQLEADVLLDRRRLIEWIFEPVLGVAGRV